MFALRGRVFRGIQIRVHAAGQPRLIPVSAPFEDVAVHVMESPGIGWVTSNFRGTTERWPRLGAVVWLPFEVCLFAAELVPERCGRRRPGAAGVFPLRLGGQSEFPFFWMLG